ncbi:MAG: histidine ammonia-lyase [Bifidobacteriaceae bacterium]|jgi:histidine ammonia-lyase|nr:histidine ammonia-lyase [Bifidobacteriaceae bacterium]
MTSPPAVMLSPGPLAPAQVLAVARHGARVEFTPEALAAIVHGADVIAALGADPHPHYGVSTGFGALATREIAADQRRELQHNVVRSHAASSGPPVETDVVRAMMLLRLATLATGRTGVTVATARAYAALLNARITPVIGEYGSLGCSGDLAPLAHCALAVLGEGEVIGPDGRRLPAARALADAGLEPVTLAPKEGLALINGTDGMLGMLLLALTDLEGLLDLADVAAAMSVEASSGSAAAFAPHIQTLRPYAGQADSARRIADMVAGSEILAHHRDAAAARVQDAYALRCAPQVHGAAREVLGFAAGVAATELASAIDNPVITDLGTLESNGNFHGAPVAYALDMVAIPVADVASMSERRTDRLLDVHRSNGLPAFLAHDPGLHSGLMIAHYTAAGLVSELKRLAAPASVDSIPSSAMQEDHVSMGWAAGRKLRRAVDGLGRVLAIEVLAAARGIDLRAPLRPGAGAARVVAAVRERVPGPGPDRYLAPDIEAVYRLVQDGTLTRAARGCSG